MPVRRLPDKPRPERKPYSPAALERANAQLRFHVIWESSASGNQRFAMSCKSPRIVVDCDRYVNRLLARGIERERALLARMKETI